MDRISSPAARKRVAEVETTVSPKDVVAVLRPREAGWGRGEPASRWWFVSSCSRSRVELNTEPPRSRENDKEAALARSASRRERCFDVEVSLSGTFPPIWRRFLLRARDTTFADLHRAIQDACGWKDYHLYRFEEPTAGGLVGVAQSPIEIDASVDDTPPAGEVSLSKWVGKHAPRACRYVYDFGDEWQHDVVVRGVMQIDEPVFRLLIGGERSFPPEDCGGMYGFARVLAFVETGEDPEGDPYVDLADWLGDWKPDIDVEALRKAFDASRKPRSRG